MLSKINLESIEELFKTKSFIELTENQIFYFQLAKDCLNRWLSLTISDEIKEKLIKLKAIYKDRLVNIRHKL